MIKELIKKRFTKSLETYSENAIVQKKMAKIIVEKIGEAAFSSVLELGCGTGFVASEILSKYSIQQYDAIDIVPECEKYLKSISENIDFTCADIETYLPQTKYDLIISNAAFQWLDNLNDYINKMRLYIKENGYFAFTVFGENHYNELNRFVKTPLKYHSIEDIKKIANQYEIKLLEEDSITLDFETPKDVLYHMKNTGVNSLENVHWTKSDLKTFEEEYCKLKGKIQLTYNPIYVILTPQK